MIMSTKYQLISLKFLGILDFIKKKKGKCILWFKKKIQSSGFRWVGRVRGKQS